MIQNISDLNSINIVLILYPSGTSGEFLACALSESIDDISKSNYHSNDQGRFKYFDLFDRTLTSNMPFTDNDMIDSINRYFSQLREVKKLHLGLMHPSKVNNDWIEKSMVNIPIIEIVTRSFDSKKFRVAANSIKQDADTDLTENKKNSMFYFTSKWTMPNMIQIEWADLILNDPINTYSKILNFINSSGSSILFNSMLQDYIQRNKKILELASIV